MAVLSSKIGNTRFFTNTGVPTTVALPISSGTAVEIDCTGDLVVAVDILVGAAALYTLALTAAAAVTNFAGTAWGKIPKGTASISVSKSPYKIYIKSEGAALAEGLTYSLSEAD